MSRPGSAVDVLLRVAARRWPVDLRAGMLGEWRAEIAALRAGDGGRPGVRWVRAVRFAASLAVSAPVEDEHGVPRGWRELLPNAGRAARPAFGLLAMAVLSVGLAKALPSFGRSALGLVRTMSAGLGISGVDWAFRAVVPASLGVGVLCCAAAGWWLGSRAPVFWAHRTRLGAAGSAVVAGALIASGVAAVLVPWPEQAIDLRSGVPWSPSRSLAVPLVWMVLIAAVAATTARLVATTARLATRGRLSIIRSGAAWLVAVGGGLLALDLTGALAGRAAGWPLAQSSSPAGWMIPLTWFPRALLDQGLGGTVTAAVAVTLRPLLLASAGTLAYGARAAIRVLPAATSVLPAATSGTASPVAATGPTRRPPATGRRRRIFAVTATAIGLVVWAYAVTGLTPLVTRPVYTDGTDTVEVHLWVQEQRLAAIIVVVLALVLANAGRGVVALPGVLVGAALLTADSLLDRGDVAGPRAGCLVFALGVLVTAVGWGLTAVRRAGPGEADPRAGAICDAAGRGALTATAGLAAFCTAGMCWDAEAAGTPETATVSAAMAVLAVLLASLGTVAALAARTAPAPSRAASVAATGIPAAIVAALWIWTGTGQDGVAYAGLLGLPFMAYTTAVQCPAATGSWRGWIRRLGVTAGGVVLGVPLVYLQYLAAMTVGVPLMHAAGYDMSYDGSPFLSGTVVVGVPLALLLAVLVAVREPDRVPPKPDRTPRVAASD